MTTKGWDRRERVLCSLKHEEPDRVPIDLGAADATGINGIAYQRLKNLLGIAGGRNRIHHPILDIVNVEDPVLEWARADCKPVLFEPRAYRPGAMSDGTPAEYAASWNPQRQPDGSEVAVIDAAGTTLSRAPGAQYFFWTRAPLGDAESVAEIEQQAQVFEAYDAWSFWDGDWSEMAKEARHLYETTDYLVFGNFSGHIFAGGEILRGFETFLMDLVARPAIAQCVLEMLTEHQIRRFDRYMEAVGPYIQVINISDDLGAQNAPLISPKLYRSMVKPHHERLFRHIRKRFPGYLFMHSDGSVAQLIPDLIEIGVQILNPVQYTAGGMDLKTLKGRFGSDLVFWGGGCDTQQVLPFGTPEQVRDEVRRNIELLGPGGGFVFSTVQIIQPETPAENLVAMYEAVAEYGSYTR
jgi:uroporphyrinogen decarboxylase